MNILHLSFEGILREGFYIPSVVKIHIADIILIISAFVGFEVIYFVTQRKHYYPSFA